LPFLSIVIMKITLALVLTLTFVAAIASAQSSPVDAEGVILPPGWTDIFGLVRFGMHGIKKEFAAKHVDFAMQAMKRAYNTIHAPLSDGLIFFDGNITSIEMKKDRVKLSTSDLFENFFDALDLGGYGLRKYYFRFTTTLYTRHDIVCRLCGPDDDALELSGKASPWTNPKPIANLFCKILKEEGDPAVFGETHGCDIFPIESLNTWDYEPKEATTTATATSNTTSNTTANTNTATTVAITLAGLNCADDGEACNNEDLRQLVSDAFTLAYNQVYFHDYVLRGFNASSLSVYRTEDAASSVSLRGMETTTTSLPAGSWRGTLQVECRSCDPDDPVDPLAYLGDVEGIFCALMADYHGNGKNDVLSTWETCSIAAVYVVTPSVKKEHPSAVLEAN
jgi:hypothetical protein